MISQDGGGHTDDLLFRDIVIFLRDDQCQIIWKGTGNGFCSCRNVFQSTFLACA
jgi:hypothetical protein